ncbi:hypothetical protein TRVL_05475 [Trypanosoma vivax]|nr:hypothetical protein TRVL_05475 [Trypanosoma vivax]
MTRGRQRPRYDLQRNIDSLKSYYKFSPYPKNTRQVVYSLRLAPYSRRSALSEYRILGAPRGQVVASVMQTYNVVAPSKQVCDLYMEVATLLSVYYDAVDCFNKTPKL